MQVDLDHRRDADALEVDWNDKLRLHKDAQECYERQRVESRVEQNEEQRAQIAAMATDFPALWRDPEIPHRERKRMVHLLIEDATIIKRDIILLHVRFKGRRSGSRTLHRPPEHDHFFRKDRRSAKLPWTHDPAFPAQCAETPGASVACRIYTMRGPVFSCPGTRIHRVLKQRATQRQEAEWGRGRSPRESSRPAW